MSHWNCCRTCLSVQCLNPIFPLPEHHEKYSSVILTVTGVKIEPNDTLPQDICTTCINFINEAYKFRIKCEDAQKALLTRVNLKQFYEIKIESIAFKEENNVSIDISNLNIDLGECDDDITLSEYHNYDLDLKKDELEPTNHVVELETEPHEIVEKSIETKFKTKKNSKNVKEKVRKKVKEKKDKNDVNNKGERTREEIKCEYCDKVLTSKLSLRNHYKIHTGFDVVCEHCGKKFITRRLLLMHCRAKHGYEKTDKCSYCDYRASNAEQVKIHERLHTGEKPYVCKDCSAGFHRKSSYLQHIAIHLPEKTVQCDQCPAWFKSMTLMRIHKNRHRAPQYSFKCRVCDNSFARRRNVARHLQRIHSLPPDQHHIDRLKIA